MTFFETDPDFFKRPQYLFAWDEDGQSIETAAEAFDLARTKFKQPCPVSTCVEMERGLSWVVELPRGDSSSEIWFATREYRTYEAACLAVALAWIEIIARDLFQLKLKDEDGA